MVRRLKTQSGRIWINLVSTQWDVNSKKLVLYSQLSPTKFAGIEHDWYRVEVKAWEYETKRLKIELRLSIICDLVLKYFLM